MAHRTWDSDSRGPSGAGDRGQTLGGSAGLSGAHCDTVHVLRSLPPCTSSEATSFRNVHGLHKDLYHLNAFKFTSAAAAKSLNCISPQRANIALYTRFSVFLFEALNFKRQYCAFVSVFGEHYKPTLELYENLENIISASLFVVMLYES